MRHHKDVTQEINETLKAHMKPYHAESCIHCTLIRSIDYNCPRMLLDILQDMPVETYDHLVTLIKEFRTNYPCINL